MKRIAFLLVALVPLGVYSWFVQLPKHEHIHWGPTGYSGPFASIRQTFLANIVGVSSDSGGLVAGLAVGDTTRLSSLSSETMKVVSLTHLTAVSGANCAIIVGLVYFLLSRLAIGRWLRISFAAMSLILYVLIVGPEPSVLRAAVMAGAVLFATGLGRSGSAASVLALSVIILLVSDPWLSSNFGFQLSVLATLGILLVSPALTDRFARILPRWLALALGVSVGAQLVCLPVLLQLQPGLSTYSIPANVLAEPLVAPITILGILGFLAAPVAPWLTSAFTWLASLGSWLILELANYFAGLPEATLGWPGGISGIYLSLVVILGVVLWLKSSNRLVRVGAGLSIGLVCSALFGGLVSHQFSSASWPPKDWSVVSCDVGQGDGTVIKSQGEVAVIDVGREATPIRNCLERLGIQHIDILVLTHFDLDHVGGLDGALIGRTIDNAIITSFQDERPAAQITWRKLRQHASSLTQAETGMHGTLGEFRWQILSPHRGASEAQDSNDGSVTMLFRGEGLVLATLADLGERGQRRLVDESANWLGGGFGATPVIVKVAHHGSADQFPGFYSALGPELALVSDGIGNDYGHPTERALKILQDVGAQIHRTDLEGSIAVVSIAEGLRVYGAGRG